MSTPVFYLIDGYAQFFRAYHAIRTPMTSPVTKEPTNMTFGFVGMLLKLLRGQGALGGVPAYITVALDVSDECGTFRSTLYPEYKANRTPPPEDLFPQIDRCLRLLADVGVPTLGAEGFEADDCIATLVTRLAASHPDLTVRIVSKDKDLKQLLRPGPPGAVELFDVHNDQRIDADILKAETGLEPRQVIDMLALMGDTADNVPGVDGIGPKTAAQLIAEYGSLDAVLAEAAKPAPAIKGKRLENIRAATDRLPLSRTLVTLRHDAPIDFDLAAAAVTRLHLDRLLPILRELGFNRYQDELNAVIALLGGADTPTPSPAAPAPATTSIPPQPAPRTQRASPPASPSALPLGGLFDQPQDSTSPAPARPLIRPQAGDYRCIRTTAELDALIAVIRVAPLFALDTETTGLSPHTARLCGISISTAPGTGVYIPVRSPQPDTHLDEPTVLAALRPILEDPALPRCGHNLKFDTLILRAAGIRLAGFTTPLAHPAPPTPTPNPASDLPDPLRAAGVTPSLPAATAFDSMVASYLVDASRSSHALDALALALLGRRNISIRDLGVTDEHTFDRVSLDQATLYAAEDADVALQLCLAMRPQLTALGLDPLFQRVEMPLVEVLAELEWNGIRVDRAELDRQRARLQARIDALRADIDHAALDALGRTFNPDSPRQLAAVLFNKPSADFDPADPISSGPGLGLKPVKKIKTGYSTDAEVLEKLAADPAIDSPIPALIVEHRELTKLVSTYLVALADAIHPRTGRIHSSFNQTVAATGRLASSDPNLQNIPIRTDTGREIRRAFVAQPGRVLVSADYSQIELRLLAHLSRDPALIDAFHQGQDIHTAVAAQIAKVPAEQVTKAQRSAAKMVNFGIVYGITPFGLARRLGCSNTEAADIIDGYKRRFAGITTFLQECIEQAARLGYVATMLGRRRPIPDIHSTNPARRSLAERTAINSVVQGSAADLIKLAMVDIHRALLDPAPPRDIGGSTMLLQIHDELVFECPRAAAPALKDLVVARMEGVMRLSVPIRADASIADNWFEGK